MMEFGIGLVVLIVGIVIGYNIREKSVEIEREDSATARSKIKASAQETITKLTEERHVLAKRNRSLENELIEKTEQLDSEVANYQAMLDQVEEDQTMMEANHKAEIESLQAHIVPPKDYPDDVVEKAQMFDHMSEYHKKMARRKFDAVTERRKGKA